MTGSEVWNLLSDYSYGGLFLYIWLGVIALPVPNEIMVLSLAYGVSAGYFSGGAAFFTAYGGVIAAFITSYMAGRYAGRGVLSIVQGRGKARGLFGKSERLIKRYHAFSLFIGCFIPGLRLAVPFLSGLYLLSFRRFLFYSCSGVLAWLSIIFFGGYRFGGLFLTALNENLKEIVILSIFLALSYIILKIQRGKRQAEEKSAAQEPLQSMDQQKG
ncbi:DedA family protein [Peribacillus kribbensis]|uniref:DedA family protein n=1 Tax=Peribacillus kribbensis TaxID=356658 RepID=UPI0004035B72|nr:DedA family protein [Peribacillus kribbensis]